LPLMLIATRCLRRRAEGTRRRSMSHRAHRKA
jgi:hypothetical protein